MNLQIPDSFFEEEYRGDFFVDSKTKRIWATILNLLHEFDKVCKKHNLTYYCDYGTLLGAVRHRGFIPWDNDVDVVMKRDDYQKLLAIAEEAFSYPYVFQNTYNSYMLYTFSKLRDARTTALETNFAGPPEHNQGIFIDIFPMDDVPDGSNSKSEMVYAIQYIMWMCMVTPESIKELLENNHKFPIDDSLVKDFLNMRIVDCFRSFEEFCLSNFGVSTRINSLTANFRGKSTSRLREWYNELVYLPFEFLSVPCPAGYIHILEREYGDYMTPVMGVSDHENTFFDPDKPYTEYL